jgi:hypothetical protein
MGHIDWRTCDMYIVTHQRYACSCSKGVYEQVHAVLKSSIL